MPDMDATLPEDELDRLIRKELAEHSLKQLKEHYADQLRSHPSLQIMVKKWEQHGKSTEDVAMTEESKAIYLDILNKQREWLLNKNRTDKTLDEDIVRKHLHQVDLEEEKLRYM